MGVGRGRGSTVPVEACNEYADRAESDVRGACLDEVRLRVVSIHASARCTPRELAQKVVGLAQRKVGHAHMLGAEREEVVDWRSVVPLDVCT